MGKINVAIIGVGNCASSLVQGVHYYRNAIDTDTVPGLMHVNLGGPWPGSASGWAPARRLTSSCRR